MSARYRPWWTVPTVPPLPPHEWYAIAPGVRGDFTEINRVAVCQNDGGRIAGCRLWPMAKWRPWGLTPKRVDAVVEARLCSWIGDDFQDLFLDFFDKNFEEAWKKSTKMAPEGPKNRGKALRPPSTERDLRSDTEIETEERARSGGSLPPSQFGDQGTRSDSPEAPTLIAPGSHVERVSDILRGAWTDAGHLGDPDLKAIATHAPALAAYPDLADRARRYYGRAGTKRRDTFWRDAGWPLALFVSQGIHAGADNRETLQRWSPINLRRGDPGQELERARCAEIERAIQERECAKRDRAAE